MPIVVMTGHEVQTCRKLWCSTVAVLDKVADVPVCAVHRGCGRPCNHAGGSATDSVHRRCGGHSSLQQRQVLAIGGYGGDERVVGVEGAFLAVLTPFFALLRVVPELSASFWSRQW